MDYKKLLGATGIAILLVASVLVVSYLLKWPVFVASYMQEVIVTPLTNLAGGAAKDPGQLRSYVPLGGSLATTGVALTKYVSQKKQTLAATAEKNSIELQASNQIQSLVGQNVSVQEENVKLQQQITTLKADTTAQKLTEENNALIESNKRLVELNSFLSTKLDKRPVLTQVVVA